MQTKCDIVRSGPVARSRRRGSAPSSPRLREARAAHVGVCRGTWTLATGASETSGCCPGHGSTGTGAVGPAPAAYGPRTFGARVHDKGDCVLGPLTHDGRKKLFVFVAAPAQTPDQRLPGPNNRRLSGAEETMQCRRRGERERPRQLGRSTQREAGVTTSAAGIYLGRGMVVGERRDAPAVPKLCDRFQEKVLQARWHDEPRRVRRAKLFPRQMFKKSLGGEGGTRETRLVLATTHPHDRLPAAPCTRS